MSAKNKRLSPKLAFFVALALFAAAAGCLGSQPAIQVKQWVLEYPPPKLSGLDPLEVSLAVQRFSAAVEFTSADMVYKPEEYERQVYPYNRWMVEPSDLTGNMLLRDLRASGLFQAVTWQRPSLARYRLEGGVDQFLEVDGADKWTAVLELTITLIDNKKATLPERLALQKTYEQTAPIAQKGAAGLAKAMSQAMAQVSERIIADVYQVIKDRQAD